MKNEVRVNLRDLILYIVKRWYVIVLCMVLGAALISGAVLVKAKTTPQVETAKKDLESLKNALDEEEQIEAEEAFEYYMTSVKNYEELKKYLANSVKYHIDATITPTYRVFYDVSGKSFGGNENIQDSVIAALSYMVKTEEAAEAIRALSGLDLETVYLTELYGFDHEAETNTFYLMVYGLDKEYAMNLGTAVEQVLDQKIQELGGRYAVLNVEKIGCTYTEGINSTVQTNQNTWLTRLNSTRSAVNAYKHDLNKKQEAYFDALYAVAKGQTIKDDNTPSATAPSLNAKIVVIGMVAGALIGAFALLLRYLLSDSLKVAEDLKEAFGQHVIGAEVALAKQDIKYFANKKGITRVHMLGSYSNEETEKLQAGLKEALKGEVEMVIGDLSTITEAEAIVFVEKIGKSTYKKIEKEIELCKTYEVPVLGFVVIA